MAEEKYLPELMAEKDSLDPSFVHASRLLAEGRRPLGAAGRPAPRAGTATCGTATVTGPPLGGCWGCGARGLGAAAGVTRRRRPWAGLWRAGPRGSEDAGSRTLADPLRPRQAPRSWRTGLCIAWKVVGKKKRTRTNFCVAHAGT